MLRRIKGAKGKYQHTLSLIKDFINDLDPLGLLGQGAPPNEYDQEIQRIAAGLQRCKTARELQELIDGVFKDSFGEEMMGDLDWCEKIAKSIFSMLRQSQRQPDKTHSHEG